MLKQKKYADLWTGIFFLAVSVIYIAQIPLIKITKVSLIDSAFYPIICAVGLTALSAVQIFLALKKLKSAGQGEESNAEEKDYKSVILTTAWSLLYVVLLNPLGFVLSSVIYMVAQMMVLCPKDEQKPVMFVIISVVAAVAIYYIFRNTLNLMLPAGILTGIF